MLRIGRDQCTRPGREHDIDLDILLKTDVKLNKLPFKMSLIMSGLELKRAQTSMVNSRHLQHRPLRVNYYISESVHSRCPHVCAVSNLQAQSNLPE